MLPNKVMIGELDREYLEHLALMRVCACLYYDLADLIDSTGDQELLDIINHEYLCDVCMIKEVG